MGIVYALCDIFDIHPNLLCLILCRIARPSKRLAFAVIDTGLKILLFWVYNPTMTLYLVMYLSNDIFED